MTVALCGTQVIHTFILLFVSLTPWFMVSLSAGLDGLLLGQPLDRTLRLAVEHGIYKFTYCDNFDSLVAGP